MKKIKRMKMSEYISAKSKPFITAQSPLIDMVPDFLQASQNQTLIANLMRSMYGDYVLLDKYSIDPDSLVGDVTAWYAANAYKYEGLKKSTEFEYNPIENYRMTEEGKDTDSGNDVTTNNYGGRVEKMSYGASHTVQENKVSPYEATDYVSKAKDDITGDEREDNFTVESREDRSTIQHGKSTAHELTRSGNIGVTTSQQMIESERNLVDFSVILVVVKDIMELTCLRIMPYCDYIVVND